MLDRHRDRIDGARSLLARRGAVAVFLGRSVAFFRAVMPALAGMALMPYRRFLVANAAGGLVWGVATVLLGYLAGNSYQRVEKAFGRGAAIAVAAVVLVAIGAWRAAPPPLRAALSASGPAGSRRASRPPGAREARRQPGVLDHLGELVAGQLADPAGPQQHGQVAVEVRGGEERRAPRPAPAPACPPRTPTQKTITSS